MRHLFFFVLLIIPYLGFTQDSLQFVRQLRKADSLLILDHFEDSKKEFEKLIEMDSSNLRTWNGIGLCYYNLGDQEKALECFDKAISINPLYPLAYSNRGNLYCDIGEYEKALGDFNFVLLNDSTHSATWTNRGRAYAAMGEFEKAMEDCQKSIELKTENPEAYTGLGISLTKLERYKEAEEVFQKALQIDPEFAPLYYNYGRLMVKMNRFYEGLALTKKGVEYRTDPEAKDFFQIAHCYYFLNQLDQAIDNYTKSLELESENATAYFGRGTAYARVGKYDEAILDLDKADELEYEDKMGLAINRGLLVYAEIGEYDKAVKNLEYVIFNAPDTLARAYAYNNLGYVYYKKESYDMALKNVTISLELLPDNSYAYKHLAQIYHKQGRSEEACAAAEKAIELDFVKDYGNEILGIKEEVCGD